MKVELKNVKYAAFASEETNCFEATIYVNGNYAGHAHNEGHGGPTTIEPYTLEAQLNVYGKTLPRVVSEYTGDDGEEISWEQNAEWIVDNLVDEWLTTRDLKRAMKNKILFTRQGKVYETKRLTKETIERARANPSMLKNLNAEKVLNFLPLNEAVEIYKAA